jgi:effector-binding domain-containing protein
MTGLCSSSSNGFPNLTRTIEGDNYLTALYVGIPNQNSCKRVYRIMLHRMETNRYVETGPAIEQYLGDMTQMMKPEDLSSNCQYR